MNAMGRILLVVCVCVCMCVLFVVFILLCQSLYFLIQNVFSPCVFFLVSLFQSIKNEEKRQRRSSIIKKSAKKLKDTLSCCTCTSETCKSYLKRLFPFTRVLDGYSGLYDLPCDVIAGLTVGIMHIPQGEVRLCFC